MSATGWRRLAIAALVLAVAQASLLVALWRAPEPPAKWPVRPSRVKLVDAPPAEAASTDPEEMRAGMRALDTIFATRFTREAQARGKDPTVGMPDRALRDKGIEAGDPGSEDGARLVAAWSQAFAAIGAPLETYQ